MIEFPLLFALCFGRFVGKSSGNVGQSLMSGM